MFERQNGEMEDNMRNVKEIKIKSGWRGGTSVRPASARVLLAILLVRHITSLSPGEER